MKRAIALRWSLAVLILTGILGWVVSGSTLYARLLYIAAFLLLSSAVWAAFSLRGIHIDREARTLRASMGDVFEERFTIVNTRWPGCLWLEVVNRSPLPLAASLTSSSRVLTNIHAHQKRFYTTRALLMRRGAFQLGPTEISSGDVFGIFSTHKNLPATQTLVVLPMTYPISTFPPPPGILPGGKTIRKKSTDVTPHAAGVREYVPGDPMKRIHWPTTAHRGSFMVKEFEQDPQTDIWLFLDAQREVHIVQGEYQAEQPDESWWLHRLKASLPRDTFEYGVSATASLARFFLSERLAVGLACASGRLTVVPAERGERQVGKILETLAFLQPSGSMPLESMVDIQAKLLPLGSGVILVTPSTRLELLLAVENLQRRNLRPIVILIKADTFGPAAAGEILMNALLTHNVPVCSISYGDDLGAELVLAAVYFSQSYSAISLFSKP